MARIRSVKPELRTSRTVARWPFETRYFFVLLWGYLDDKGRGIDAPKLIAGDCFPYDEKVTASKVDGWLNLMAEGAFDDHYGPVCRYEVRGQNYIHCVNWPEHQKPNRPTPSRLPPCPLHEEDSEAPLSDSVPGGGEQGRRGAEEEGRGEPPPPRCGQHVDKPTTAPCGGCKEARLAREAWDKAAGAIGREEMLATRKCRHCDAEGQRYEPGTRIPMTPYVRCDHRPLRSVS